MAKVSLTNTYKTYPEYKDSEVDWVGQIPKSWDMGTSRRLFSTTKKLASETNSEKVLSLTLKGVIPRVLDGSGKNPANYDTYQEFKKDDLVFCLFDYDVTPRTIGYVCEDGMMTGAYTRLIPKRETDSKFFYYFFLSLDTSKELLHQCTGLRNSISKPIFWSMKNPLPPKEEQDKIAAFLDVQTARIDASIAKKKRLIELLKEKRTAIINQAVTKGLDPKAELVDSGIEWIGKIPKGWEVKKLKHQLSFLDGKRIPLSTDERTKMQGDYPYYGASGIIDYVNEYIFDEDLILISEDGANLINRSTPISFIATGQYWVNNHAHIAKPKDGNIQFWSERIEQVDVSIYTTGSAQPKLTIKALANIQISAPSDISERLMIGAYVAQTRERFERPISQVVESIKLLQELKSSLISHAVTGKIKI